MKNSTKILLDGCDAGSCVTPLSIMTPSGLFLGLDDRVTRYWVTRHRRNTALVPMAIQLDPTPDRPAFSIVILGAPSACRGVWLGATSVCVETASEKWTFPNRAGFIRWKNQRVMVRCTAPDGCVMTVIPDELIAARHSGFNKYRQANFEAFTLNLEHMNGTRTEAWKSPPTPIFREPYEPSAQLDKLTAANPNLFHYDSPLHI